MSRVTFRHRDLKTALKAAQEAGVPIGRIELRADGTVVIIPGVPPAAAAMPEDEEAAARRQIEEALKNAGL